MVDTVLNTDMGVHFDFMAKFRSAVVGKVDLSEPDTRLLAMQMGLKCGDLGHSAKSFPLHLKWTERINEEFFLQGDEERKRGIAVTPFYDRTKQNIPKSQVGFLDFIVIPMYTAWSKFLGMDEVATSIPCSCHANLLFFFRDRFHDACFPAAWAGCCCLMVDSFAAPSAPHSIVIVSQFINSFYLSSLFISAALF